jgi:D-alanyl-D-alanine carboxypeptidase/D-alanyl-D-alanine-endopeptidase (penicillin-binding protein 4)
MPPSDAGVLFSIKSDSLYQLMMQQSDNFIAEQLLLICSELKFGNMKTEQIIDFVLKNQLGKLPDSPKWIDGSGLSRYNLITPRSLVRILDLIRQQMPKEKLLEIFPAGGISGTIEGNYKNGDRPYIFAKTGTLRNNHCLSGYLMTKSGKLLVFSFMHNNFTIKTSAIKKEMERVLKRIYEEN